MGRPPARPPAPAVVLSLLLLLAGGARASPVSYGSEVALGAGLGCCGEVCDLATGRCECLAAEVDAEAAAASPDSACRCCEVETRVFTVDLGVLYPGQVVNTAFDATALEMPKGRIGLMGFMGEVIDEAGASVPLDEVYNHHVAAYIANSTVPFADEGMSNATLANHRALYDAGLSFSAGPCFTGPLIGSSPGAEGRNSAQWHPEGYAFVYESFADFAGNIHVLRLANTTSPSDCLQCNCRYMGSNPYNLEIEGSLFEVTNRTYDREGGGIACCQHGTVCPTDLPPGDRGEGKRYLFRYTVSFVDLAKHPGAVKPLVGLSMLPHVDASLGPQNYGYDVCLYEYNSPVCEAGAAPPQGWPAHVLPYIECVDAPEGGTRAVFRKQYRTQKDLIAVNGQAHLHNGGLSMSVYMGTEEREEDLLCRSHARYGTGEGADAAGMLVQIGECSWPDGLLLPAGTDLLVVSEYVATPAARLHEDPVAQRLAWGPPYDGVMSYWFMYVVPADGEIDAFFLEPDGPANAAAAQCTFSALAAFSTGQYTGVLDPLRVRISERNETVTLAGSDDPDPDARDPSELSMRLAYRVDEANNTLGIAVFFYPPPGMEDAWLAVGFADPGAGVDELGRPHAGDADLIVGERFVSAEDAGEEAFVPQFDTEYTITSAFAPAGGGLPIPKTDAMSPGIFGESGKACAYAQMTDSSGLYYMFVERPLVYANNAGGAGGMAVDLAKGQPYHLVWAVGSGPTLGGAGGPAPTAHSIFWTIRTYEPLQVAPGDTVTFTYDITHDVVQATSPDQCSGGERVGEYGGPYTFAVPRDAAPGAEFHFYCDPHCEMGQRITVTVASPPRGAGTGAAAGADPLELTIHPEPIVFY